MPFYDELSSAPEGLFSFAAIAWPFKAGLHAPDAMNRASTPDDTSQKAELCGGRFRLPLRRPAR